jgi:tRNA modification GTPase
MISDTTICAIASGANGALSIIRISGPESYAIVNAIFRPATAKKILTEFSANTIHFGTIVDDKEIIDEVLLSLFKAPNSYTGEDVIEISCHGSVYVQQKIMELLIQHGAEPAKPGDYTQRALLNV